MYIEHRTLVSFRVLTSIYDNNQHWKFNHVLRSNGLDMKDENIFTLAIFERHTVRVLSPASHHDI
jgi:hypothetical protein